jgi:hypothetical protein
MLRIIILFAVLSTTAFAAFPNRAPARDLAAEHALLARFEGSWTEVLTFKPSPEAEAIILNGTAHARSVMGGRFLEMKTRGFHGEAMHEGVSMMGFEPEKERFSCVSFDNQDTTFNVMYGCLNPTTQELSFEACFNESKYVYVHSLPRNDKYRWSFKQIKPDGTTGWEMSAIGTRIAK